MSAKPKRTGKRKPRAVDKAAKPASRALTEEKSENQEQTDMSRIRGNLRELALRVAELQEQARSLGLFPGDRELLECPKCGLLEDVTIAGELISCVPSAGEQDSGLRFEETSPNRFRCPACGSIFRED